MMDPLVGFVSMINALVLYRNLEDFTSEED